MPSSKSSLDKRDIYYRLHKSAGYRARSAYKLLHLDEEFDLFSGVETVVDLCAAPGSWSQVVAEKLGSRLATGSAKLVSLDLQPMAPLKHTTTLQADLTTPSTIPLVLSHLATPSPTSTSTSAPSAPPTSSHRKADLVICDGAPDVTGVHDLDAYLHHQLLLAAVTMTLAILAEGGTAVYKIFLSPLDPVAAKLRQQLRTFFPGEEDEGGWFGEIESDDGGDEIGAGDECQGDGGEAARRVAGLDTHAAAQGRFGVDKMGRRGGVWVRKPRSSRKGSGEAFLICRNFDPSTVPLPAAFSPEALARLASQTQGTLSLETLVELARPDRVMSDEKRRRWDIVKAWVGAGDLNPMGDLDAEMSAPVLDSCMDQESLADGTDAIPVPLEVDTANTKVKTPSLPGSPTIVRTAPTPASAFPNSPSAPRLSTFTPLTLTLPPSASASTSEAQVPPPASTSSEPRPNQSRAGRQASIESLPSPSSSTNAGYSGRPWEKLNLGPTPLPSPNSLHPSQSPQTGMGLGQLKSPQSSDKRLRGDSVSEADYHSRLASSSTTPWGHAFDSTPAGDGAVSPALSTSSKTDLFFGSTKTRVDLPTPPRPLSGSSDGMLGRQSSLGRSAGGRSSTMLSKHTLEQPRPPNKPPGSPETGTSRLAAGKYERERASTLPSSPAILPRQNVSVETTSSTSPHDLTSPPRSYIPASASASSLTGAHLPRSDSYGMDGIVSRSSTGLGSSLSDRLAAREDEEDFQPRAPSGAVARALASLGRRPAPASGTSSPFNSTPAQNSGTVSRDSLAEDYPSGSGGASSNRYGSNDLGLRDRDLPPGISAVRNRTISNVSAVSAQSGVSINSDRVPGSPINALPSGTSIAGMLTKGAPPSVAGHPEDGPGTQPSSSSSTSPLAFSRTALTERGAMDHRDVHAAQGVPATAMSLGGRRESTIERETHRTDAAAEHSLKQGDVLEPLSPTEAAGDKFEGMMTDGQDAEEGEVDADVDMEGSSQRADEYRTYVPTRSRKDLGTMRSFSGVLPGMVSRFSPVRPMTTINTDAGRDVVPAAEGVKTGQAERAAWVLVRRLGEGAFSSVWAAKRVSGGSEPSATIPAALKLLPKSVTATNDRTRIAFIREVEVLSHLSHSNVVAFIDHFETSAFYSLALEAIGGGELFDIIQDARWAQLVRGTRPPSKSPSRLRLDLEFMSSGRGGRGGEVLVRRVFSELCRAVGFLHAVGVVHRDIKLENILFVVNPLNLISEAYDNAQHPPEPASLASILDAHSGPLIKLTDFGLSRFITPSSPSLTTRCGSESFAAPEIIMGKSYDGRDTDSWACGVVLYAMMVGELPFDGPSRVGMEGGDGWMTEREEREERKRRMMRIAKAAYKWPSPSPSRGAGVGGAGGGHHMYEGQVEVEVDPSEGVKSVVGRLLVRDPNKRARVGGVWDEEWMKGEGSVGPPIAADVSTTSAGVVDGMGKGAGAGEGKAMTSASGVRSEGSKGSEAVNGAGTAGERKRVLDGWVISSGFSSR